ncbi:type II toxin-antitoxin system VapC family toxin [Notoacmeibacter marinus]|uniref:type II toxin-antitoxin system VapC family toxin n=1 Tax=Notoacmeibacter marinus TaxID=1876515 RepID=UPI000DF4B7CE|nr:type II toxin-antitoxin system VapC family toxin [Notoacmeibacter marinus]
MAFLLDTNVISETVCPKPEARVLDWLEKQSPEELFLSAMTIGELMRGAYKVKEKLRRDRFTKWIEDDLSQQFYGRVLPFGESAAQIWGESMGTGDRTGKTPSAFDAQIAAIAIDRSLVLVTRNVSDFERFDLEILNPWDNGADN